MEKYSIFERCYHSCCLVILFYEQCDWYSSSECDAPVVGGEVLLPPEENAIYQLGDQFSKWLGTGLADNWSQVGIQCLCAFLIVCTCMVGSGGRVMSSGLSIERSVVQSHLSPFRFSILFTPHLPVSFGRDTKSWWSFLSGVYARGSKRSHTGGKCVICVCPSLGCLEETT